MRNANQPPIIEVNNVTKEFRLGAFESVRSSLGRLLGKAEDSKVRFRALDDVSFHVQRGEVVGIIGHNGAGKSTLLKHMCNISKPTHGSVVVRGRVAPLIEVSAGLIGNMTGRENIYLNASILGMTREQVKLKMDEIIDFAELREFIDTPVKRYSSGMQIRLAFSIAISADAAVLIVDEVLAVGDLAFQRKCYDRISTFMRDANTTVLVVSHNIRQIERLCSRVLYFERGQLIADGKPDQVCALYYKYTDRVAGINKSAAERRMLTSTGEVELLDVGMVDDFGNLLDEVAMHDVATCRVKFRVLKQIEEIDVAIGIQTSDYINIITQSIRAESLLTLGPGSYILQFQFQDLALLPADYTFRVIFQDQLGANLIEGDGVGAFAVNPGRYKKSDLSVSSLVHFPMTWKLIETGDSVLEME